MPKFDSYAQCRSPKPSTCRSFLKIFLPALLVSVVGVLFGLTSAWAQASGYSIQLVGVADQYTLPVGSSGTQTVDISGPSTGDIHKAYLTLNGTPVRAPFKPTGTTGTIEGQVPGFQPGDNLLQLYAQKKDSQPAAQLRTSILLQPTTACTSMAGVTLPNSVIRLPTEGVTISTATITPATGTSVAIPYQTPEYCNLTGFISPATSTGLPINFTVVIPTQWNQKSWQIGGGGNDGSIPGFLTRPQSPSFSAMLPPTVLRPIALGYALYGGDSGHTTGNAWVDSPNFPTLSESFQNFTFDSLNKTHDAAVAVMNYMYGKAPAVNYFAGQSQGGREALTVLWRYPLDYDGIMAQDFLAYFSNLNFNPQLQGAKQVSPPAGYWVPGGTSPLSKAATLRSYVVNKCDGLDGLVDGVIQDYVDCMNLFDPVQNPDTLQGLNCNVINGGTEAPTCLTDDEIATLTGPAFLGAVQYPYLLMNGETSYPGWGPLEGLSLLVSSQPTIPTGTTFNGAGGGAIGGAEVREYFCGPGGSTSPTCNVLQIFSPPVYPSGVNPFTSPTTLQSEIQTLSQALDISDDWSAFMARGGKAILDTSGADTIANTRAELKLHDRVVGKLGQTAFDSFVRHYVSPMTGHGGGANAVPPGSITVPTTADLTTPMIRWVEELIAPPDTPTQMLFTTSGTAPSTVYTETKSRPLCRYPMYPHYNGGDPTQASGYTCTAPLTSWEP